MGREDNVSDELRQILETVQRSHSYPENAMDEADRILLAYNLGKANGGKIWELYTLLPRTVNQPPFLRSAQRHCV